MHSGKRIGELGFEEKIPDWDYKGTTHLEEMVLITQSLKEVQMIMSTYVGIVRSDLRLQRAMVGLKYSTTKLKAFINDRLFRKRYVNSATL